MTEQTRKRGRPKARAKKAYTIRLESELARVLDMHTSSVKELYREAVLNDLYESIFSAFFFAWRDGILYPRDAGESMQYMVDYAINAEYHDAERWHTLNMITEEDIEPFAQRAVADAIARQKRLKERLEQLQAMRASFDRERQLSLILELQERIQALEAQQETTTGDTSKALQR